VKYNKPIGTEKAQKANNQDPETKIPVTKIQTRKYNNRIFPPRPDGGPVTRSKKASDETPLIHIQPQFDCTSAETVKAVNLIKKFVLIDSTKLFKKQMVSQKPENLIKKIFQLAQDLKTIIQQLNSEQKAALKNSLK
jgi:hypothetical protein